MLAILLVTFPFFALILCGYIAARRRLLPEVAIPGLNTFVLYFALPCMLYRFGSSTPIAQLLDGTLVAVYLACLGERNFMQIAEVNAANAVALRDLLTALPGIKRLRTGVHFNEFAIELPIPAAEFCMRMKRLGIFAGVPLAEPFAGHQRGVLIAVTETKNVADLEAYAKHAKACLEGV